MRSSSMFAGMKNLPFVQLYLRIVFMQCNLLYVTSDKEIYVSHLKSFCHSFSDCIAMSKMLIIGFGYFPCVVFFRKDVLLSVSPPSNECRQKKRDRQTLWAV